MERPFPAYNGTDPYIFISYAHANAELIYPEIIRLKARGFNIWYDEGIAPGASWRDELAERLVECSVFVFFVTAQSVKSVNCNKEVSYALTRDRPILTIYLESVSLPPGLEFSLSDVQAVEKFRLNDSDFCRKVDSSLDRLLPKSISKINDLKIEGLVHHSKTYTKYVAKQDGLNREVEIILLGDEMGNRSTEAIALDNEAQLFSQLNHRNFQTIYATGQWEGKRYYVMEKGSSRMILEDILSGRESRNIPLYHIVKMVQQLATILDVMSQKNLVLPVLGPRQLVLRSSGDIFLKFLSVEDCFVEVDESKRYASPEQLAGETLGIESNYYSVGVMVYEMITGLLPYSFNSKDADRTTETLANLDALRQKTAFEPNLGALTQLSKRHRLRQNFFDMLFSLLSPDLRERLIAVQRDNLMRRSGHILSQLNDNPDFLALLAEREHHINPAIIDKIEAGKSLSDDEFEEYRFHWFFTVNTRFRQWKNYQQEQLTAEAFNKVEGSFQVWFKLTTNLSLWEKYQTEYEEEFVTFINEKTKTPV